MMVPDSRGPERESGNAASVLGSMVKLNDLHMVKQVVNSNKIIFHCDEYLRNLLLQKQKTKKQRQKTKHTHTIEK